IGAATVSVSGARVRRGRRRCCRSAGRCRFIQIRPVQYPGTDDGTGRIIRHSILARWRHPCHSDSAAVENQLNLLPCSGNLCDGAYLHTGSSRLLWPSAVLRPKSATITHAEPISAGTIAMRGSPGHKTRRGTGVWTVPSWMPVSALPLSGNFVQKDTLRLPTPAPTFWWRTTRG